MARATFYGGSARRQWKLLSSQTFPLILILFSVSGASQFLSTTSDSSQSRPSSGSTSSGPSSTSHSLSITSIEVTGPHTTFFTRSTITFNSTSHNSSTSSIDPDELPLGPANNGSGTAQRHDGSAVLNYYFAFLAVFVIILFIAAWLIHKRKARLKALRASSRQNALSRDLDGWAGRRRWVGGAFRGGIGRRHERETSREEGLNELGEAPPPYKARDSVTGQNADTREEAQGEAHLSTAEPSVPLRTLDRNGRAAPKPPEYVETAEVGSSDAEASNNSSRGRQGFRRMSTQEHIGSRSP